MSDSEAADSSTRKKMKTSQESIDNADLSTAETPIAAGSVASLSQSQDSLAAPAFRRMSSAAADPNSVIKKIVFGSYAQPAKKSDNVPEGHSHKWKIFVQGYQGEDISHWVSHVIIRLHESFKDARRVIRAPPYEVNETGWGEFDVNIEIHAKDPKLRAVGFHHHLKLWTADLLTNPAAEWDGDIDAAPLLSEKYEELIFTNPISPCMRKAFDDFEALTDPPTLQSVESEFSDEYEAQTLEKIAQAKKQLSEMTAEMLARKAVVHEQASALRKEIHALKLAIPL